MGNVKAIPDGYRTVQAYLVCHDAARAIEFYTTAFGAQEMFRMPGPGGKVMHAELRLGDSVIMLCDENPQMGMQSPQMLGGTSVNLFLYVEDCDAWFARATAAGCATTMPPMDMFWGDRFCKIVDPFGHAWGIATHKEDVAPDEMERRAAAAMGGQAASAS